MVSIAPIPIKMFLRSLSIICSRTVFGKRYPFGELKNKHNANFAALTARYSTARVYDDNDDDVNERPQFKSRFTRNDGNSNRKTYISSDVNRNRDFRYNFDKKYDETPDWKPFEKNFYKPLDIIHPKQDVDDFLSKHKITIKGPAPSPIMSFDEICLPDYVANELKRKEFTTPTPIQAQCWPIALSGKNLVGVAQTGSGKTLGYILPAIVHIKNQEQLKRGDGPIALVLGPTRELVQQIQQVTDEFGAAANVRNAGIFGGAGKGPQANSLQRGR